MKLRAKRGCPRRDEQETSSWDLLTLGARRREQSAEVVTEEGGKS